MDFLNKTVSILEVATVLFFIYIIVAVCCFVIQVVIVKIIDSDQSTIMWSMIITNSFEWPKILFMFLFLLLKR